MPRVSTAAGLLTSSARAICTPRARPTGWLWMCTREEPGVRLMVHTQEMRFSPSKIGNLNAVNNSGPNIRYTGSSFQIWDDHIKEE
ncbi:hypothetical protein HNY73_015800 [Argiope bruennichi]|uniref:Uncharacterized protein n=1 Tax=Argiope bruennichi TaxID=94029 RepID=A0A8T0EI01_ARGBR|nr:hypothetical protein HNY73_015800 [Argiope bruennichi]